MTMEALPSHRDHTPTLPTIRGVSSSVCMTDRPKSIGNEMHPAASNFTLPSSAKLRRQLSKTTGASSPQNCSTENSVKSLSRASNVSEINRLTWNTEDILNSDVYEEKKERLLRTSKLRKDLEVYFNVETPSRLAVRNPEPTKDEDFDTDLDPDLVSLSLIVDEKTKQIKDDGEFPEYKNLCRKFNSVPNSYFIRHSVDDELTMKHRYLSTADCKAMGWEVENHLTIKKLDLEDNGLGPKQMMTLAEMLLKNNYVQEVNLSNNPMGPLGAHIMKVILKNNGHIVKVDLTGNNFGERAGENLAEVLEANTFLKELYIGKNQIGDSGVSCIGKALEYNITLQVLDLSWNRISRVGAAKLASGIKVNGSLKTLNLSMNGLGADGCRVVFDGLRGNESLTSLDLSCNRIPDRAADHIAKVLLYDRALTVLKLSYNNFTTDGAVTILKSLGSKMKKKLERLELDGTDVNEELAEIVRRVTSRRGLVVTLQQPPSRREQTSDPLTRALVAISRFLIRAAVNITELFPDIEKRADEACNTYQIIELIKSSDREFNRSQVTELRKICKGIRRRQFLLREFALVYSLQQEGRNPLKEDPLRSQLSVGKRRSSSVDIKRHTTPESNPGVRFQ